MRKVCLLFMLSFVFDFSAFADAVTYPAPVGYEPSPEWTVPADGKPVFVASVATLIGTAASYGGFDYNGSVEVVVHSKRPVKSVKILPAFINQLKVEGDDIKFPAGRTCNLTIEIKGSIERVRKHPHARREVATLKPAGE